MQIISKTDTDGIITGANKNFCKLSGYSEQELIGKSHNIIRHPDMKDAIFEKMWQTITSGKIWKGEVKNLTKTGGFYWTNSVIFPIFDDDKNIVEYISFREDITKRKAQEIKLLQEKSFRREILNAQPNMAILIHRTKGVIFMNNQCFTDLPFDSRVDFLKEHECICELFVKEDDFLKPSTEDKHWLKDFDEFPDKNHKAIILNRNSVKVKYQVKLKVTSDNENLIVVNFLNIKEDDISENLEIKISSAISTIDSLKDELELSEEESERLNKIKAILSD